MTKSNTEKDELQQKIDSLLNEIAGLEIMIDKYTIKREKAINYHAEKLTLLRKLVAERDKPVIIEAVFVEVTQ